MIRSLDDKLPENEMQKTNLYTSMDIKVHLNIVKVLTGGQKQIPQISQKLVYNNSINI